MRRVYQFFLKALKYLGIGVGICFLLEIVAFTYYYTRTDKVVPADAVVVFRGDHGRVRAGYDLASKLHPRYIVVSQADQKRVKRYNQKFRKGDKVKVILEERARTTFENVVLTTQIAKKHNIQSIILVTSDYHQPRSMLLYKLLTWNTPLKIYSYRVSSSSDPKNGKFRKAQLLYNEMLEFAGSLVEYCQYSIKGDLPLRPLHDYPAVKLIKKILLFEIKQIQI